MKNVCNFFNPLFTVVYLCVSGTCATSNVVRRRTSTTSSSNVGHREYQAESYTGSSSFSSTTSMTSSRANITDANFRPLIAECLSQLSSDPTACDHLVEWDTGGVTDCSLLFWQAIENNENNDYRLSPGAQVFNVDLSRWDTSSCTTMRSMFHGASAFNQPIGNWNVANVVDMAHMFQSATTFNQDISTWNTQRVTDMSHMFRYASHFHNPILPWNTARVKYFSYMFLDADQFNGQIGSWDIGSATDDEPTNLGLVAMFDGAKSFNQPLHQWQPNATSRLYRFDFMFQSARLFNQDLSHWDVHQGTDFTGMFHNAASFNQRLCWEIPWSSKHEHILENAGERARIDANTDCWRKKKQPELTIPNFANVTDTNHPPDNQIHSDLLYVVGMVLVVVVLLVSLGIVRLRRNKYAVALGDEEEVFFDRDLFQHKNLVFEDDGLFRDPIPENRRSSLGGCETETGDEENHDIDNSLGDFRQEPGEAKLIQRIKRRSQIRQKIQSSIQLPLRHTRRRRSSTHPKEDDSGEAEGEISFDDENEVPIFGNSFSYHDDESNNEMQLEDAVIAMETMIQLDISFQERDDCESSTEDLGDFVELHQFERVGSSENGIQWSDHASSYRNECDVDRFRDELHLDVDC